MPDGVMHMQSCQLAALRLMLGALSGMMLDARWARQLVGFRFDYYLCHQIHDLQSLEG
jgi:hypothetical protein